MLVVVMFCFILYCLDYNVLFPVFTSSIGNFITEFYMGRPYLSEYL